MPDAPGTPHAKLRRAGTRAGIVGAVILFGRAKGVPLAALEAATGLTLADLVDPDARVPDRAIGAAWAVIGEHCPGEAVALEMAAATPLSLFGPLAQAARYAATRGDALELFARYDKVLSGGLDLVVRRRGEHVALVLRHSEDEADGGMGAEAAVGLAMRVGREVLGLDAAGARVEFAHAPRCALEVYEAWFGMPVRFGAEANALLIRRETLDLPPPRPQPEMVRYVEAHLDLVHRRLIAGIEDAPLDRVRGAIADLARRSVYGAEPLAKSLGMSVRTLQRYTTRHGASLRSLIEEARAENARDLLSDQRLSVEEVAFLLGYADDRAFRRAFKRWTGATPARFRSAGG